MVIIFSIETSSPEELFLLLYYAPYLKSDGDDLELLHLTTTNKRDIQKAMGDRLADWGMKLSLMAPEARRDDMCFIEGKMVYNDWTCDQDDW